MSMETTHYNDQLRELQQQVARSKQLEAKLAELRTQRDALTRRVLELEAIKLDEQKDVDRLEGRSLAAFFYNVIGKMDEKLDAERREAYAATVKYDAAARELAAVESELQEYEYELASLAGCDQRYAAVLQQKAAALKTAGGANAEQILGIEEEIAALEVKKKELKEAICVGKAAFRTSEQVMASLDSAEGWSTWDIMGGGLLADMAKHSDLDEAQEKVEQLQGQLRKFKTELADVSIQADMQVNVDGFLRFADYFFDGLFTDWAVMDKIDNAQQKVKHTQRQIRDVISQLQQMLEAADVEQSKRNEQMEILVLQA